MATREPQLPRAYSDGKVFGKHDLNKEKLAKIKERNRAYATENANINHVRFGILDFWKHIIVALFDSKKGVSG